MAKTWHAKHRKRDRKATSPGNVPEFERQPIAFIPGSVIQPPRPQRLEGFWVEIKKARTQLKGNVRAFHDPLGLLDNPES